MKWFYEDYGLTRETAIQKLLEYGFVDAEKGWQMPTPHHKNRRFHIIPSWGYFEVHEDTKGHTVKGGEKGRIIIRKLIEDISNGNKT